MSNAVSLFNGGLVIPAYLQTDEVDEMTRSLAGGSGGLRVSIKGGVWRLLRDGDEIARNEERAMNFVVVASSPDTQRTFYEGTYQEGESKPPTCWSSDGVVPDAVVKNKQSDGCAKCPQNVAGSGDNGTRACRFSRRLAVVVENDIGGSVYGIQLPAQSIFGKPEQDGKMPLQAYGKLLAQHRIPVNRVVTEFRFDTNSATPKITFKAVRPLTPDEIKVAEEQGKTPDAQAAIAMTVFAQDNGGSNGPAQLPNAQEDLEEFEQGVTAMKSEAATVGATATVAAPENAPAVKPAAPAKGKGKVKAAPAPAAEPTAEPEAAPAPAAARKAPPPPGAKKAPPPPAAVKKEKVKVMTEAAEGASYDDMIEAGWTDDTLLEHGMMVIEERVVEAAPAEKPRVVPPPAAKTAPQSAGVQNILSAMGDDDDD